MSGSFLDPIQAEITLYHELTHSIISRTTEMGQAEQSVYYYLPQMRHLDNEQRSQIKAAMYQSQVLVQEGFASFMEVQGLVRLTDIGNITVAKERMPQDYRDRFEQLEFAMLFNHKQRERFTRKIALLPMQTNIRRDMKQLDLLENPEDLKNYLSVPDNNPHERLNRLLDLVRKDPRVLRKKPREIARRAGIKYFEPTDEQEISDHMNYVLDKAGLPEDFTPELVRRPDKATNLREATESLLVTNLNLRLAEEAEMLHDYDHVEYEAERADAVFAIHHSDSEPSRWMSEYWGRRLDIDLILFRKTGEKYLAIVSSDQAKSLLDDQLSRATFLTKWGTVEPPSGSTTITPDRKPDVVIYNRPQDMLEAFKNFDETISSYEYIHLGYLDEHPYQSILVKLNGEDVVHFANAYGNAKISELVQYLKDSGKSSKLIPADLAPYSKAISDNLAVMGLRWDVDWVQTMIQQDRLVLR